MIVEDKPRKYSKPKVKAPTPEPDDMVNIPVSEKVYLELDKLRKTKPDGTKESDDEVIGRLLDNLEATRK